MHLLPVYDTAQLRCYIRIVREYLVYSAFSRRHVRWGGGLSVEDRLTKKFDEELQLEL